MEIVMSYGVLIAITFGLIEVIKGIGLNSKYAGAASVIIGIGWGIGIYFIGELNILQAIMAGFIIGLSAVGLYSAPKNAVEGIKGE